MQGAGRPPSVLQRVGPAPQGKGPGLTVGAGLAWARSGCERETRLSAGLAQTAGRGDAVESPGLGSPCTAWVGAGHTAPQAGVRHRGCRVCRGKDRAGGHSCSLHALTRLPASAGSSLSFSSPGPGMTRVAQAGSSEVGGPDVAQPTSGCTPLPRGRGPEGTTPAPSPAPCTHQSRVTTAVWSQIPLCPFSVSTCSHLDII